MIPITKALGKKLPSDTTYWKHGNLVFTEGEIRAARARHARFYNTRGTGFSGNQSRR